MNRAGVTPRPARGEPDEPIGLSESGKKGSYSLDLSSCPRRLSLSPFVSLGSSVTATKRPVDDLERAAAIKKLMTEAPTGLWYRDLCPNLRVFNGVMVSVDDMIQVCFRSWRCHSSSNS